MTGALTERARAVRFNVPQTLVLRVVVAFCALGLAGCSVGGAEVQGVGCVSDDDCGSGMQCFEQRVCVLHHLQSWDVVLRVAPAPGSALVEEHFFAAINGMTPSATTWQLTRPAQVRGRVKMMVTTLAELVPGTLLATTPGLVPGTRLRYSAISLLHARTNTGASDPNAATGDKQKRVPEQPDASFELAVAPGHSYDVAFWPQNGALAPHYEQLTIGGDIDDLLIELPIAPDALTVTGRMVARPTAAGCDADKGPQPLPTCGVDCKPIAALRVALHDERGRVRSTRVVTDADGRFSLSVPADAGALWLNFEPTDPPTSPEDTQELTAAQKVAETLPSGRFSVPIDVAAARKSGKIALELGDLDLGKLPDHYLMVRDVVGDHGLPLIGARVHVLQQLDPPKRCVKQGNAGGWTAVAAIEQFEVRRSALTDGQGPLQMRLLQAPATLLVEPPSSSSSASWLSEAALLPPTADPIRCPARRRVRGTTDDYRGRPIHAATVQIQPLPAASDHPQRSLTPVFAASDDAGNFAAWLDPGRYAVTIEPPADSGLARALVQIIDVKAPNNADTKSMELKLQIAPPTVLYGTLLGTGGEPRSGVLIDVLAPGLHLLSDDKRITPIAAASARDVMVMLQTHLLGSAVTDSAGRFEVLVAPGQLQQ